MEHKNTHLIHLNYRPDIDGLRAIAIISVVLFHYFQGIMPGGFVGVDIFFVISGFLISSIIFSSLEHDRFSLIEFYIRRIRRIFPALTLVLITVLVIGWFLLFKNEFSQLGKHTAAGAGFIENFALWHESGFYNNYFSHSSHNDPLLHLWTLAIEEQFYIFWPLLLAFVWKRQWNFLAITAAIGILSFSTNIYLMSRSPTAAFYMPMSRFWELMIGGVLSYLFLHHQKVLDQYKNWQALIGLILIASSLILLNKNSSFPGWWALLPTIGTFAIISSGPTTWVSKKILSNNFLVWIGLISYPLYLWHWVLLSYLNLITKEPTWQLKVFFVLLSVFLSWLTYEYIEKKFRFGIAKKTSVFVLSTAMITIAFVAIAIWHNYIPVRNNSPMISKLLASEQDWEYPKGFTDVPGAPDGVKEINSDAKGITLFIGDSHIKQYGPRVVYKVSEDPQRFNKVIFAAYGACPPIPNVFTGWNELRGIPAWASSKNCQAVKNYAFGLLKNPNLKTLVIGMSWDGEFGRDSFSGVPPRYRNYYSVRNGKRYQFIGGNGVSVAIMDLNTFIESIPKRIRVALILDEPHSEKFSPVSLASSARLSGDAPKLNTMVKIPLKHYQIDKSLLSIPSSPRILYIDASKMFCKKGYCKTTFNSGSAIYKDNNHLTSTFVRAHAKFIDNLITPN